MAHKPPPLRLTQLRIKNFRSVGEAEIALGPLTVLVGPNGSGKSNVVDALRFLRDCFTRGLDQAILDREGLTALRRWSASGRPLDVSLGVTISDGNQAEVTYDFILISLTQQGFSVKKEEMHLKSAESSPVKIIRQGDSFTATYFNKKYSAKPENTTDLRGANRLRGPGGMMSLAFEILPEEDPTKDNALFPHSPLEVYFDLAYSCTVLLQRALFYTLNPVQLRAPQRLVHETPFDEAGENLSAVLRQLRRGKRSAEEVRTILTRLVAGIVDFSVSTTGSYLVTYLHYKNAAGKIRKADLGQESDGTLRVLGILAALYQQASPAYGYGMNNQQLLVIEEPEVNIHPGMLAVLADSFKEASLQHQLLLTTHSPDLLDFLPPESFAVVEKVDGETRVGALAADQAAIVREQLFSVGELLRTEGLRRQSEPSLQAEEAGE